jgi:hypothetical protein
MKNSIIIIMLLMSASIGYSQISFEGRYDASLKTYLFKDGSLKYLLVDNKENLLHIYNTDNTLWYSIELEVPKGHMIDDIELLTDVGESDSDMIVLYTCYYFDHQAIEDVEEPFVNLVLSLNVLNGNGTYLLQIPQIEDFQIVTSGAHNKLLVYTSETDGFDGDQYIGVYSLNGK